jgi:hypothetical protein
MVSVLSLSIVHDAHIGQTQWRSWKVRIHIGITAQPFRSAWQSLIKSANSRLKTRQSQGVGHFGKQRSFQRFGPLHMRARWPHMRWRSGEGTPCHGESGNWSGLFLCIK